MDPHTVNVMVAVALMLLTVTALLLIAFLLPLLLQAGRTLIAYEKLADTLQNEVPPTLSEFRHVAERVNQLGSVTTQRVTEVSHKVEEVSGSLGQAAGQARRQSRVWGTGLLAGIKAYLGGKDHNASDPEVKQLTVERGEHNVELRQ